MRAEEVLHALLRAGYFGEVVVETVLPEVLEDVFPRHVEAAGATPHVRTEALLAELFVHEVASVSARFRFRFRARF